MADPAGEVCPCCDRYAKIYDRKINSTQARALIHIVRSCGQEFGHLPTLRMALAPHHSNEEPKLRFWGLLEEEAALREDGGRAGWWRATPRGEAFVAGTLVVPKYARIYDDRLLGLHGEFVSIRDCVGDRFNYDELMSSWSSWRDL